MIIFGWGHKTNKDFGETFPMGCGNCNNKVFFRYLRVREWFTLFFIPVFPYSSKHLLICPVCSGGKELDYDQIKEVSAANELTQRFMNKEIKETEYKKELKSYQKRLLSAD